MDDLYNQRDKFHDQFAADALRSVTGLMAATQPPITDSALEEAATSAAWHSTPSGGLIATEDYEIPPAAARFESERAKARTVEIDASHAVSVPSRKWSPTSSNRPLRARPAEAACEQRRFTDDRARPRREPPRVLLYERVEQQANSCRAPWR
ncbi:hypothetical protein ACFW1F_02080 [Streptomyces bungoensis]|uniref:hypothetical protein n=1 Tax=Streptomyces bungoensis TaxID=285568 RepID=UPI00342A3450